MYISQHEKRKKRKYRIVDGGYIVEELLAEIESRLLFDAVWDRLYIPTMLEAGQIVNALRHMTMRELQVLAFRYQAPEGMAMKEIADRLGISRERVRQIDTKALMLLRESVGQRPIFPGEARKGPL